MVEESLKTKHQMAVEPYCRRQLELTRVASSGSLAASGGPTKPPLSSARLVQISG